MDQTKERSLIGAIKTRACTIEPQHETADDRKLTFVMISENNEGTRHDWWSGDTYIERLEVDGADTSRLRTFFKDHNRGVDDAIGRVESVSKVGGSLKADVVFGSDTNSEVIMNKYREGILTDVSIGYIINKYTVEERKNEPDIVTVTDFSILELSSVGIGFDQGAKHERNLNLKEGEKQMEETNVVAERDAALQEVAELKRQKEIMEIGAKTGADTKAFLDDESKTVNDFMRSILDLKAEETKVVVLGVPDELNMKREISDAMAMKLGSKKSNMENNSFRGASMLDIARSLTGYTGYNKTELASRAMVTTDFPVLLVESGNRVLSEEWMAQPTTYGEFVKEVDLPDFKITKDVTRLSAGGRLDRLSEGGELKEKYLSENAEAWNLKSYGNKFALTREMLINDDLGAFSNMLEEFTKMAANTANGIVYDLLLGRGDYASYKMADGYGIFHSNHKNIIDAALTADTMAQARVMMRRQVGGDGKTPLNITPAYIIVSPELETTARKIVNSVSSLGANENSGVVNTEYNSVKIIVDAAITSPTGWIELAANRTIKAGYLAGTGRQPILQTNTSTLSRVEFEGIFDFGVMAEDFRGLVRGNI